MPGYARSARLLSAFAFFILLGFASPALAQQGPGLRAGVSVDPDQFYFGAHYDAGPIVDQLRFRPNGEVGIGNDLTLFALNLEFVYLIPRQRREWRMYVGGGPAINIYSFDRGGDDDTEVEPGFNFLFGVQHRGGFFAEFKIGGFDSPDLKFGVGYTFQ